MVASYWALATEDPLSEAVGRRLLAELPGQVEAFPILRRGGREYLRARLPALKQISRHQGVLLLTDLDRMECPLSLLKDWLDDCTKPENLLLRIPVRTVESWVLADHEAMRRLIGPKGRLPPQPDELANPKQHLLRIAQEAPRAVRADIVKLDGTRASQGIGYNARLSEWIGSTWSPSRAAQRSPSLQRARQRLYEAHYHITGNQ